MVTHACNATLGELRQKDCEFEACMGYIRESVFKTLVKTVKVCCILKSQEYSVSKAREFMAKISPFLPGHTHTEGREC